MGMKWHDWVAIVLLLVGGLVWGLIGFFDYNIVDKIFNATIARVIYSIVGVATVWSIIRLFAR